ncbi:unnamed protein product [Trichobilharzia szidati]|nr:unnamed protein product [Trichobilharzia szidati]
MLPNHANNKNGSINKPTSPTVNSIGTHNVRNITMAHTDNQRHNNASLNSTSGNSQNSTTNNSGYPQYGTQINFDRIYGTSLLGTNPQSSTHETHTRTQLVPNNRWKNKPWSPRGPNHFLSPASLSALKKQLVGMSTLLNR